MERIFATTNERNPGNDLGDWNERRKKEDKKNERSGHNNIIILDSSNTFPQEEGIPQKREENKEKTSIVPVYNGPRFFRSGQPSQKIFVDDEPNCITIAGVQLRCPLLLFYQDASPASCPANAAAALPI